MQQVSLKPSTLAFYANKPAVSYVDFSVANLQKVVARYPKVQESLGGLAHPENEALTFYCLNHLMALTASKFHALAPLGKYDGVAAMYHQNLAAASVRMFYYLLLICTRESRHIKDGLDSYVFKNLRNEYGENLVMFHNVRLRGQDSMEAVQRFLQYPPSCQLGVYTAFMRDIFYKGSFSSAFGGAKWGKIADVLHSFVKGTTSAEMMMDTAFTLAHNTGAIFNKGMLYHQHTHKLQRILDVQRAGMIPQLIGAEFKSSPVIGTLYAMAVSLFPELDSPVDWFKVEQLGAIGKYSNEKAAQEQTKNLNPTATPSSGDAKYVTLYPGGIYKVIKVR